MANAFRRMPVAAEVHTFEAEICSDQELVPGRDTQRGAVVPDTGNDAITPKALSFSHAAQPRNQFSFRKRQASSSYAEGELDAK